MNRIIYLALKLILRFNERLYGASASREVLRDLSGEWLPKVDLVRQANIRPADTNANTVLARVK